MIEIWNERYGNKEFIYGKEPNVFLKINQQIYPSEQYFFRQKERGEMQFMLLHLVRKFLLLTKALKVKRKQCNWQI